MGRRMMFIFNSIFKAVAFNSMERSAIYNPRNVKHFLIQFLKWWCSSLQKKVTHPTNTRHIRPTQHQICCNSISEVVVLRLTKKVTHPTNTCHIQPTQYQTCWNSISEVVVIRLEKGDTPSKHFPTYQSMLKQI